MMLHTDMALTWEPAFKKWVDIYADDEERWFNDFSKYYQQLNELGCKNLNGGGRQFIFVSVYLCLFVLFQCSTATAVPFSFLLHVKSLITYKFCYCLSSIFPNSSFICSLAKKSKREEHFTQPFYSYTKKYIHGVPIFHTFTNVIYSTNTFIFQDQDHKHKNYQQNTYTLNYYLLNYL